MVAFGPRPAASEALSKTRAYIVSELQKAGLKAELDEFEAVTPRGRKKMTNVRASRPGTGAGTIALVGHYDTKIFNDVTFVGANDGGSSAAWLLEMARITQGLRLQNTLGEHNDLVVATRLATAIDGADAAIVHLLRDAGAAADKAQRLALERRWAAFAKARRPLDRS